MSTTQDRATTFLLCAGVLLAVLGCGPETTEKLPSAQPPEEAWVALSQIVIQYEGAVHAPPKITRTKEEALKLAGDISMQIRAGGDFIELAKKHSDDSSGADGGTLGVVHSSNMAPPIAAAGMALALGGVSDPVETKFGFHVIRRDHEVEMAAALVILITHAESKVMKPTRDRTKEEALARAREVREKLDYGADFAELVLEYSDSTSRVSGGDLGSFPRGVSKPEIDAAVFSLEVGEISDVTETQYGFHIFYRYE